MRYSRVDILSQRLRSSTSLRRLSRRELFSRMQLIQTLEPIFTEAYTVGLRRIWREQMSDSPHGHPWHISFHASQFPGDDAMACGRQAMYRMMDLPGSEPPSRRLHLTAITGKAIEVDLVTMLSLSGILISAPPDAEIQTGFEMPQYRLTGTVDSAIARRSRVLPVEIKTKHESVIEEMRIGKLGPDEAHVKQIKTQIGLIREAQQSGALWDEYKTADRGYIYYLPRDTKYAPGKPIPTAEFLVEHDEKFFQAGLKKLEEFIELWNDEELPSANATKRHPLGWRWSYPPCQFCSYKKVCQEDHKDKVVNLAESNGIEAARLIREDYDYEAARERVEARWTIETRSAKISGTEREADD